MAPDYIPSRRELTALETTHPTHDDFWRKMRPHVMRSMLRTGNAPPEATYGLDAYITQCFSKQYMGMSSNVKLLWALALDASNTDGFVNWLYVGVLLGYQRDNDHRVVLATGDLDSLVAEMGQMFYGNVNMPMPTPAVMAYVHSDYFIGCSTAVPAGLDEPAPASFVMRWVCYCVAAGSTLQHALTSVPERFALVYICQWRFRDAAEDGERGRMAMVLVGAYLCTRYARDVGARVPAIRLRWHFPGVGMQVLAANEDGRFNAAEYPGVNLEGAQEMLEWCYMTLERICVRVANDVVGGTRQLILVWEYLRRFTTVADVDGRSVVATAARYIDTARIATGNARTHWTPSGPQDGLVHGAPLHYVPMVDVGTLEERSDRALTLATTFTGSYALARMIGTLMLGIQRLENAGMLLLAHQAMFEEMLECLERCDQFGLF